MDRVEDAQRAVEATARRLGLQYRPRAFQELIMYTGAADGANGLTQFKPNGEIYVDINPEVALDDPVLLELTLIHEDVHYRQYQRLGRQETLLEQPELEVEAYFVTTLHHTFMAH